MKVTMLNGLPVTMLNGLGCNCDKNLLLNGIGAVADYDIITIGGKRYTVNQIIDKRMIASRNTPIYRGVETNKKNPSPFRIIKSGEEIGRVYSYLKSTGSAGRSALMYYDGANYTGTPYYSLNEDQTIDTGFIKEQGAKTVGEEIKAEQEKAEKDNNPVGYYLKKYGLPTLLIGGSIYLAATYGKEIIKAKLK